MRACVICNALVRPGKNIQIVWLAGVLHPKRLREQSSLLGKAIDVGSRRGADDGSKRMVLFHHDHHVVWGRNSKDVGLWHRQGDSAGMSNAASGSSHRYIGSSSNGRAA